MASIVLLCSIKWSWFLFICMSCDFVLIKFLFFGNWPFKFSSRLQISNAFPRIWCLSCYFSNLFINGFPKYCRRLKSFSHIMVAAVLFPLCSYCVMNNKSLKIRNQQERETEEQVTMTKQQIPSPVCTSVYFSVHSEMEASLHWTKVLTGNERLFDMSLSRVNIPQYSWCISYTTKIQSLQSKNKRSKTFSF